MSFLKRLLLVPSAKAVQKAKGQRMDISDTQRISGMRIFLSFAGLLLGIFASFLVEGITRVPETPPAS